MTDKEYIEQLENENAILKKQKEISKEAERVVDSIITDDMTELEKEIKSRRSHPRNKGGLWLRL